MKKYKDFIIQLFALLKGYYIEERKLRDYPLKNKLIIHTKHNIITITEVRTEDNNNLIKCRMYHINDLNSPFVRLTSHMNYYYVRDEIKKRKTLDDIFCFLYQVFE